MTKRPRTSREKNAEALAAVWYYGLTMEERSLCGFAYLQHLAESTKALRDKTLRKRIAHCEDVGAVLTARALRRLQKQTLAKPKA